MTRFERWAVWSTSLATAVTGLVYVWMEYVLEPTEPWAVVNHPLQPWVLKAHILVAPLLVFALGMIVTRHIWRHVRTGVQAGRRSGLTAFLTLAPMVVTGYLLQVVTHEAWLGWLAVAHIASGALFVVGLAAHYIASRSARREPGREADGARDGPDREPETRIAGDVVEIPTSEGRAAVDRHGRHL
ncbi:MAG: hypothetical protein GWN71_07165 [Gammaproteobacteria bacterium]|nr:hypothetical protein [Gemmatimonadota bacterium]NIU73359.1 hypothetical protein [Gammaproteobacteria bacterium]